MYPISICDSQFKRFKRKLNGDTSGLFQITKSVKGPVKTEIFSAGSDSKSRSVARGGAAV